MKRSIQQIIAALGLFLGGSALFSSCESVLFIELEEGVKIIVLNGALNPEDTVAVQVSRTRHILDNARIVPLEEATVHLYENGQQVKQLSYAGNGYYTAPDFVPAIGMNYTIEVENEGYEPVQADCSIPEVVPILSLDTASKVIEQSGDYYYGSQRYLGYDLTLEDPAGEDNYYLLSVSTDLARTEWVTDTTYLIGDSVYVDGVWSWYVRDTTYSIYEVNRYQQATYTHSEDIIVEGYGGGGILFSDQLIDGKSYSVSGWIDESQLRSADSCIVEISLRSISADYFKYLLSAQKHYIARDDALSVPVIVYSNVVDGAGILGGYSADHRTITTFVPEDDWGYYYYYE